MTDAGCENFPFLNSPKIVSIYPKVKSFIFLFEFFQKNKFFAEKGVLSLASKICKVLMNERLMLTPVIRI